MTADPSGDTGTISARVADPPPPAPGRGRRAALVVAALLLGMAAGAAVVLGLDAGGPAEPGPADVGFSQDMAVHHEQAVDMATTAAQKASPEVRSLAISVQLSQARESGTMRGWLQLWGAPQLPGGRPMSWMPMDPASHAGQGEDRPMAGMASQDELNRLNTMRGAEFDTLFLQLMIRHHQGGVLMAREARPLLEVPAVDEFAVSAIGTQTDEITAMTGYLLRNGAQPLPAPG